MTRLLLVRHAQTAWNVAHRYQGQVDIPLDACGHRQAARLAERLAREVIDAVYTSDLARTRQTAAPLLAQCDLEARRDGRLRELNYGAWEGLTVDEILARYPEQWRIYRTEGKRDIIQDGESLADGSARIAAVFDEIVADHAGETVLVVSHGGTLRIALCHLLGLPTEREHIFHFDNTSISDVRITQQGPRIKTLNEHVHLLEMSR